jgi:hypothetical protein
MGKTKLHRGTIPYFLRTNDCARMTISRQDNSIYHTSRGERKSAGDIDPPVISVLSGEANIGEFGA